MKQARNARKLTNLQKAALTFQRERERERGEVSEAAKFVVTKEAECQGNWKEKLQPQAMLVAPEMPTQRTRTRKYNEREQHLYVCMYGWRYDLLPKKKREGMIFGIHCSLSPPLFIYFIFDFAYCVPDVMDWAYHNCRNSLLNDRKPNPLWINVKRRNKKNGVYTKACSR